jgi:hypothetical protein
MIGPLFSGLPASYMTMKGNVDGALSIAKQYGTAHDYGSPA